MLLNEPISAGRMGKGTRKVDSSLWEGITNEAETTGRTKSADVTAATRTRRFRKEYDTSQRQEKRIYNEKIAGAWKVNQYS